MRRNPSRTPKTQKMLEEEASTDATESETSENSISDEPKTPENEVTEYETQRELRVSENRAKMEAMGLQKIANSLVDLSENGKRKSQRLSIRVSKKGKEDVEYEPNADEEQENDGSDSSLNISSEEFDDGDEQEKNQKKKKKRKKNMKGKKISNVIAGVIANVRSSMAASEKVEVPPKVLIPNSSLQFTGYCGEKICLEFPTASEEEVKKLMGNFPQGFNGFDREQTEKVLRWVAGLKRDYWRLRRKHMRYPEFREEAVEGLPLPEGFNGFNFEESKQISEVIVELEQAYSSLKKFFQSNAHEGAKGLQPSVHQKASSSHPLETSSPPTTQVPCPQQQASTASPVQPDLPMLPYKFPGSHPSIHHEASGSIPLETSCPPTTQVSGPQQQAPTFAGSPAQSDVPRFPYKPPGYRQYPPNWYPPMGPYGMAPMPWNPYNANYPPPSMGNYSGMPYYDAGMRPFPPWHSQDFGSA